MWKVHTLSLLVGPLSAVVTLAAAAAKSPWVAKSACFEMTRYILNGSEDPFTCIRGNERLREQS